MKIDENRLKYSNYTDNVKFESRLITILGSYRNKSILIIGILTQPLNMIHERKNGPPLIEVLAILANISKQKSFSE